VPASTEAEAANRRRRLRRDRNRVADRMVVLALAFGLALS
jgi:hypothetical protein